MEWEDLKIEDQEKQQLATKGWSIQNLLQDEKLRQAAKNDWGKSSTGHKYLTPLCTKDDLDKEVEWFENNLVELLNNHAKITRVCAYSKRWWNKEVAKARTSWAKDISTRLPVTNCLFTNKKQLPAVFHTQKKKQVLRLCLEKNPLPGGGRVCLNEQ